MNALRKIVSLLLMTGAVIALIGVFMGSGAIFQPLMDSLSPFDFRKFGEALNVLITGQLGMPFMLFMIGFIGLTMPRGGK